MPEPSELLQDATDKPYLLLMNNGSVEGWSLTAFATLGELARASIGETYGNEVLLVLRLHITISDAQETTQAVHQPQAPDSVPAQRLQTAGEKPFLLLKNYYSEGWRFEAFARMDEAAKAAASCYETDKVIARRLELAIQEVPVSVGGTA
jgi:hypothetical protein